MTAGSHKQIKKRHGCLSGMAREYGLTLQWRFAREVKQVKRYVHPEWILDTVTEYQAWVLVRARETKLSESEKRHAILDSVLRQLDRDETENPGLDELPSWVAEPFEYEDKRDTEGQLSKQFERERWHDDGVEVAPPPFDDPNRIVDPLDVNFTREEAAL